MRRGDGATTRAARIEALGYDYGSRAKQVAVACNLCGPLGRPVEVARRDRYGYPAAMVVCRRCGLGYLSPRLTGAGYAEFYAGVYRPLVSAYHGRRIDAETVQVDQRAYAVELADFLAPWLDGVTNILDVGGSTGVVAGVLAGRGHARATVLDPAPDELAVARAAGMETIAGCAEDFDGGGRTWDLVLLCQTIDHLVDPAATLDALRAMTAPGGRAFVDVLDIGVVLRRTGGIEQSVKIDHPYYLTPATATALFTRAGYEVVGERRSADGHHGFVLAPARPAEPDWARLGAAATALLADIGSLGPAHEPRHARTNCGGGSSAALLSTVRVARGTGASTVPNCRKVCVVVASRANLARITTVLEAVRDHPALKLQVVAAASALLERFGGAANALEKAGFTPDAKIRLLVEGQTPATMAKSTGLGLLELPTVFEMLEPDIVVTVADRFETIATAIAAAYMNIPVAHTQGGDVSGSIDESVRHAVTKLSHVHFPATELSARRIVAMGEDPRFVFDLGCPSIDLVARTELGTRQGVLAEHGDSASPLDPAEPFLLVLQHPVTTEYGRGLEQINATLHAIASIGMQALVFWPNADAGSDEVATGIREFREQGLAERCHFVRHLPAEDFTRLMAHCACMIGNSSAALREGAYLGTPAVNVGSRQRDRECAANVVSTSHDPLAIADAVRAQVAHGPYPRSSLFGNGTAGPRIAAVLSTVQPPVQKRLHYTQATWLAGV